MQDLPDDPIVRCIERSGYPPWVSASRPARPPLLPRPAAPRLKPAPADRPRPAAR